MAKAHPQGLIYPLTVAAKSLSAPRKAAAERVLGELRKQCDTLVEQASLTQVSHLPWRPPCHALPFCPCPTRNVTRIVPRIAPRNLLVLPLQAALVSSELIRTAILWHEQWHTALEEASRFYFGAHDVEGMLATLEPLHAKLSDGPETSREAIFLQVDPAPIIHPQSVFDARELRLHRD